MGSKRDIPIPCPVCGAFSQGANRHGVHYCNGVEQCPVYSYKYNWHTKNFGEIIYLGPDYVADPRILSARFNERLDRVDFKIRGTQGLKIYPMGWQF